MSNTQEITTTPKTDPATVWENLENERKAGNTTALAVCRTVVELARITRDMASALDKLETRANNLREDMPNGYLKTTMGDKLWFDPTEIATEVARLGVLRNQQVKAVWTAMTMYGYDDETAGSVAHWVVANAEQLY